jgi:hypothetical protein
LLSALQKKKKKMNPFKQQQIKPFAEGHNWYEFNQKFFVLASNKGISIYFNPIESQEERPFVDNNLKIMVQRVKLNEYYTPPMIIHPTTGVFYQPLDQPYELSSDQSSKWKHYKETERKFKQGCLLSICLIKENIDPVIWQQLQNRFPDETNIEDKKNDLDVQVIFNYLKTLYGTGSTVNIQKSENAMAKIPMFHEYLTAEKALLEYQNLQKERESWGLCYHHSDTTKISWLQTRVNTTQFEKILHLIEDNPSEDFEYFLHAINNHIKNLRRRTMITQEDTNLKSCIINSDISINVATSEEMANAINVIKRAIQCYVCQEIGHMSIDCPNSNGRSINPITPYVYTPNGTPARSGSGTPERSPGVQRSYQANNYNYNNRNQRDFNNGYNNNKGNNNYDPNRQLTRRIAQNSYQDRNNNNNYANNRQNNNNNISPQNNNINDNNHNNNNYKKHSENNNNSSLQTNYQQNNQRFNSNRNQRVNNDEIQQEDSNINRSQPVENVICALNQTPRCYRCQNIGHYAFNCIGPRSR